MRLNHPFLSKGRSQDMSDNETDYRTIYTNVIPEVDTVRFYQETIVHVKAQHPEVPIELPCVDTAVSKAIAEPTHVESSYSNSFVFVDAGSTNRSGDPLRVPVKIIEGTTSARVKTVYFASTEADNNVIWRRSDEQH